MSTQYIVVVEADLSGSAYGAKISTTEPLDKRAALATLDLIARGEKTPIYAPYKSGVTVRVSDYVLLDISRSRTTTTRQTRITAAEIVSDRT